MLKLQEKLTKGDDLSMGARNEARLRGLGNKLEEAHLAFKEVGGGFYRCNKDRSGVLADRLYTDDEVKDYFKSNNKVLIQVRDRMNKFGEYNLSPLSNFDSILDQ